MLRAHRFANTNPNRENDTMNSRCVLLFTDENGKPLPGDYISDNRPKISTADEFQDSLHGYPIYWYYNDTSLATTYTTSHWYASPNQTQQSKI